MKATRLRAAAQWTAGLGLAALGYAVVSSSASSNFPEELALIWSLPWGKAALIDTYVGIALVAIWICLREAKLASRVLWIIALLTLGNIATCVYVLIALAKSGNNLEEFFLGSSRR